MTTTNIKKLAELVSTAQATYGDLDINFLKPTLISGDSKFTDAEADNFVKKYALINQLPDAITGFSATVFQDKTTGKKILAIRGTQGWTDINSADLQDIAAHGFANRQAVDLYRYWKN